MSNLIFASNYYSFRSTAASFAAIVQPLTPEQVALATIEADLMQAHNSYLARRYQDAIKFYRDTEALIYAQLDPGFPFGFYGVANVLKLGFPRTSELFEPLLSASLEWMNLLPVRQPVATVHPRVAFDNRLLATASALSGGGLLSSQLAPGTPMNAAADVQLSRALTSQGNQAASQFFSERALKTDATTVKLLQSTLHDQSGAPNVPGPTGTQLNQTQREALPTLASTLSPRELAALGTPTLELPPTITELRSFGTLVDSKIRTFTWPLGGSPALEEVRSSIYVDRISLTSLVALQPQANQPSDKALQLPHDYYYVIPLGLAECHHALGQWDTAEAFYFQAAAYQFLNTAIEAPYLWQRLATLYLDWGNFLFRQGDVEDATDIYERVLNIDETVPDSTLYTTASLKPGADAAVRIIAGLGNVAALTDDPALIAIVVEVKQQLIKIVGGLDFWGHWHNSVPIWTFEFLQSVAVNFAQLAIGAERDVISFWERADTAALTRQQLVSAVAQSDSEVNAASMQAAAATAEVAVYTQGKDLADLRAKNAADNASSYAAVSADQVVRQAVAAQLGGGDDGDANDLNRRADALMGIGPTAEYIREHPGNWHMEGSGATLSATEQLVAARLNRQYEIDSMDRQTAEMNKAASQAGAELDAANARSAAAGAGVELAKVRQQSATNDLGAFDNQLFTADVWHRMGDQIWRLYRRYLNMALKTSLLMQQAYNFEMDESLHIIKSDYVTDEVKGLLGADALMADIQSFTFDLVTNQRDKPQPLRQTISLATRYGFQFETEFRKTGIMEFETRVDDFDLLYPGTYAGRIDSVEVEVEGIVPPIGFAGTLTNSGISGYRTPASVTVAAGDSGVKYRVQSKETLVLSDYNARFDAGLVSQDSRQRKVFQGAGVISTWRLELPKAVNDVDYGALTDVRLTFYYKARYDPDLNATVLAQLAGRPGVNAGQRGFPLRWLYPDAFFHFQDTGTLDVTLAAADFRRNETNPVITDVGVMVVTDGSLPAQGLRVSLSTPTQAAITAACAADGTASSATDPSLAPLAGASALGDYQLGIAADENPSLVKDGKQVLTPIVNIALILGYSFTPRS